MDNQNNQPPAVRPVIFMNSPGQSWLYFNDQARTVEMSTVRLEDLTLKDFERIHKFFHHVKKLRYGAHHAK